jgi:hypothetical protein
VEMLLEVLKPYAKIIKAYVSTLLPTIHEVFQLYNHIFFELEKLERKYQGPKKNSDHYRNMLKAIIAAKSKLSQYYG